MPWYTAGASLLEPLVAFLSPLEWSCVGFSSQLRNGRKPRLPARRNAVVHYYTTGDAAASIQAALLETAFGFCYPVLGSLAPEDRQEVAEEFGPRLRTARNRYLTFMGLAADVAAFERLVDSPPLHRVQYYMMRAVGPPISKRPTRLDPEPQIRRAGPTDTRKLLPLQIAYEREEVLLPNRVLNTEATRRQLRSDLKQQLVFVAEVGGTPIAKAGTNARGFRYDQIGGVFTDPRYRNLGVAALLMDVLMRRVRQDGKAVCLFVKTANHAARRMYRNLGFDQGEEFVISYYH